jgi:hypothetical protein
MSRPSKTILIIGVILLVYGYLCRKFEIDFFWDSKTIGVILLFIALLSYWIDLRRTRKRRGKKLIWVTVGICFLILGLVTLPFAVVMIKTSDAYDAALQYLDSDPKIKEEIGNVKGFGLIPTGSVATTTINGVESGGATFEIIVKGEKKYMDVTIRLEKKSDKYWTVTDTR